MGILQVQRSDSDEWGTVCDDQFGESTAHVICKWMGYDHAHSWDKAGNTYTRLGKYQSVNYNHIISYTVELYIYIYIYIWFLLETQSLHVVNAKLSTYLYSL